MATGIDFIGPLGSLVQLRTVCDGAKVESKEENSGGENVERIFHAALCHFSPRGNEEFAHVVIAVSKCFHFSKQE